MLQFLDKQTLNFSSVMGIIQDLHLVGRDYSWSSSVFYIGYLVFSYPASILMVRLPLGKYLGGTCLAWAICLACHAATKNFTGLAVVRFFLGATEASISPGFSLITGMFYKRSEQPFRHGIWFFGNSLATMFGGLFAYGIAHIQGGLGPWRVSVTAPQLRETHADSFLVALRHFRHHDSHVGWYTPPAITRHSIHCSLALT